MTECKVLAHTVLVLCRIYSFLLDIYLFLVSLRNKLLFGFRGVCDIEFVQDRSYRKSDFVGSQREVIGQYCNLLKVKADVRCLPSAADGLASDGFRLLPFWHAVPTAFPSVCKQGFLAMQRSLVCVVKKPCLECKEALFEMQSKPICLSTGYDSSRRER